MSRLTLRGWIATLAAAGASGAAYSSMVLGGRPHIGALYAMVIIGLLLAFEQDLIFPKLRLSSMRRPTAIYFLITLVINMATIAVGTLVVGTVLWSFGLVEFWLDSSLPTRGVMIYGLCVSALIVFVLRIRDLVGPEVFVSLLISRYRQPRLENRVFLLIDLVGSTSYAERFGDLRTQRYLGEVFRTIALSVRRFGGSVDDYMGDASLITWTFKRGIDNAACIRCVLHILDAIRGNQAFWVEEFGEVPSLRAALHGGPIIVAEIGLDHRKITYFGDTVNTTSRIEGLARTLGRDVLISDSLFDHLPSSDLFTGERLGTYAVKGKGQTLSVTAIAADSLKAALLENRRP